MRYQTSANEKRMRLNVVLSNTEALGPFTSLLFNNLHGDRWGGHNLRVMAACFPKGILCFLCECV